MNIRHSYVAVALAVLPAALLAQDSPAPASPPVEAAASATGQADGAGVTGQKGKETLSVDFPNAEIRTILRNIADLFDLNLVIPETLEGRASLKLRDVTWRQIFDVLLQPVGYTYVTDGNIIKIVSIESLNVEPVATNVYILNYARASEIAATVNSMIDTAKGGKLQVETRSNALVVTERPKRHEQIREIISRLDRATDQVMIETKFVEVSDRSSKNLGLNWASLNGWSVGSQGPITSEAASVTDYGSPVVTNPATGVVTSFGSPPQIAPPATADHLGDAILTPFTAPQVVTSTFSADEFRVVLSALESLNGTRLVSNPTVVTLNNQEAVIAIGEQYPIPSYRYSEERGTFEVDGFEYKDIGINLKVTPQVNNAGLISLKVNPEVSSRQGTTSFGGASGAAIPIIATRRTSTQVALKDGYTMGLGGLIEDLSTNGSTKIPGLGSIPGIGGLFKSKSKETNKRNLVIFITAKILSPEGSTYRDVFTPTKMAAMGVTDADAPVASEVAK
jgi:type IV pilus assembly protein PilQ